MPNYDYITKDGEVVERTFRIADKPRTITLKDGRVAKFIYSTPNLGGLHDGWPYACKASAVQPGQGKELAKLLSDKGVPTQVNKLGQPIYRNQKHNDAALKVRGLANYS